MEKIESLLPLANSIKELGEVLPEGGKLIVIEGMDGSGKTSVLGALEEKLAENGVESAVFRNFIEGPFWKSTMLSKRQISRKRESWPPDFDRGLQMAVYLAHLRYELIPLLSQYQVVLSDRGDLSKLAFCRRAYDGEVGFAEELLKAATDIPIPDLLIYLKVSPETANQRIQDRLEQGGIERDWRENTAVLEEVEHWYDLLLEEEPFNNAKIIEAEQPLNLVVEDASSTTLTKLEELGVNLENKISP